jgi:hypothetical protein
VSAAIIAASASVVVAVLAFILNQRGQASQERRQANLARVNSQLRELYGPLHALVNVNERIWESLRETGLPPQAERRADVVSNEWRRWRDRALMPANLKMRDLIIDHADLLAETVTPEPLQEFCAHVSSLEVLLFAEAEGLREPPLIRHPGASYVTYVRDAYARLKHEQQELLRTIGHS